MYAANVEAQLIASPAIGYGDAYGISGEPAVSYLHAAGPLAISSVAIFGNESFFGQVGKAVASNDPGAVKLVCQNTRMPFLGLLEQNRTYYPCDPKAQKYSLDAFGISDALFWQDSDYMRYLTMQTADWFQMFADPSRTEGALGFATFYANEALLTLGTSSNNAMSTARNIYSSPGRNTTKPSMSLTAMIILSTMLAVEVVGFLWIAFYASRTPTWASSLDSIGIAQLANGMERSTLSPAGSSEDRSADSMHKMDGRVGVETVKDDVAGVTRQLLVLGGREPLLAFRLRTRQPAEKGNALD